MTVVVNVINWLQQQLITILHNVISIFPSSPFAGHIDKLSKASFLDYLAYLNWLIPGSFVVDVTLIWLAAVGTYYMWSVLARWLKLVD